MGEDALAGALVGNDGGGEADVTCLPGSWGGGGARVWTGHGVRASWLLQNLPAEPRPPHH